MTFGAAVASALRQYATFRGRAPRAEYWWFCLFDWLVTFVVAGFVDRALGTGELVSMLSTFALMMPFLAVTVRRLHDSDLAGWWALPPFLGLVLFYGGAPLGSGAVTVVGLVLSLGGLVGSIVLALRPSTLGDNRFGPHPYGHTAFYQSIRQGSAPGDGRPSADPTGVARHRPDDA